MVSKFSGLALGVELPARMTILHPITRQTLRSAATGEDAYIDLLAMGSPVGRAHDRAVTDKQIKMRGRRITAEEIDADYSEKLAKLTRAWSLVTLDGTPIDVEYSPAAARELYSLPELSWLRDQVAEFVADLGNFPVSASTN